MGGWLDTDNKTISVQLNLTGTTTGTELSNFYSFVFQCHPIVLVVVGVVVGVNGGDGGGGEDDEDGGGGGGGDNGGGGNVYDAGYTGGGQRCKWCQSLKIRGWT